MRNCIFLFLFLFSGFWVKAQTAAGLWQGQWESPEGYIFAFVMHIDQFPDNSLEGYINWQFKQAPAGDWYYKNKKDLEATEFVKGKLKNGFAVEVTGYKKDDPHEIISLDSYKFMFDETYGSFSGITGNHGSWKAKISAVRVGLP